MASSTHLSPRYAEWWSILLVSLVVILLYAHTLHVPWYMDDASTIVENPLVHNLGAAWSGVLQPRGITTLSFALNYQLGGLGVSGYHLVNIAIHILCGSLVQLLLRRIFRDGWLWPLFGALFFVVHPLQTQAVTYTTQRMASLSALFFLLGLYLFVRSREQLAAGSRFRSAVHLGWYAGALLSGALAMLSKESAAVLPLALVLFARFFSSPPPKWKSLLLAVGPFFLVPLVMGLYHLVPVLTGAERLSTITNFANLASLQGNSPFRYLVTEFSVLWIYLRLLFYPYGQALDHDYPVVRELLTWQNSMALLGLLVLGWIAWRQRKDWPVFTFAVAWYFLTLAVESSVIPLDPLFEHRLYLPMFGYAAALADGARRLPWPQVGMLGAVLLILVLSVFTWRRNLLWNDQVAFYQSNLRIAPRSERVNNGLAASYYAAGRLAEAESYFKKTLELNPGYLYNYGNLPALYLQQGRVGEAIALYEKGLGYLPNNAILYNNLAVVYENLAAKNGGSYENARAVQLFEQALKLDRRCAPAFINLGRHYKRIGRLDEAVALLLQGVGASPLDAAARADLAEVYLKLGWLAAAAAEVRRGAALEMDKKTLNRFAIAAEAVNDKITLFKIRRKMVGGM